MVGLRQKHGYMVINRNYLPILTEARMPIFWNRKVAQKEADRFGKGENKVIRVAIDRTMKVTKLEFSALHSAKEYVNNILEGCWEDEKSQAIKELNKTLRGISKMIKRVQK